MLPANTKVKRFSAAAAPFTPIIGKSKYRIIKMREIITNMLLPI
jgi:hypothetical protein